MAQPLRLGRGHPGLQGGTWPPALPSPQGHLGTEAAPRGPEGILSARPIPLNVGAKAADGDSYTRIPMETIHGAELVLLSFPEQNAGEYTGGLLTIATPLEKNWHWLRVEDYANVDDMLLRALDYAKSVGIDHVHVIECTMVEEYMVMDDDEDDDEDMEGEIELESPC